MSTRDEVIKIMGVMVHAYPSFELKQETIKIYTQMLSDIPAEILEASARQIMAEMKFFPSVAEWRDMAHKLTRDTSEPNAFEAWQEVIQKIRDVGQYRKPEFSHPLIQKSVDCLGWMHLCMSESIEYDRSQFYKIYDAFSKRNDEDKKLLPAVKEISERFRLGSGS